MDKKTIATIAVVAVLVVAGCAAYLTLNNNDKSEGISINDLASTGNYLKIFGNANGDFILDNKDVEIIQDYINGKIGSEDLITVTEPDNNKSYYLADSNCYVKVDSKDITYLKGIIDLSGSGMNIIDTFGHLLNVPLKIDRIACDYFATAELLSMVGVQNEIVAALKALCVLSD